MGDTVCHQRQKAFIGQSKGRGGQKLQFNGAGIKLFYPKNSFYSLKFSFLFLFVTGY